MNAKELYQEVKRRYPHSRSIYAQVSCQDVEEGKVFEYWSVLIHGENGTVTHTGHGTTGEQCLGNIRETHREVTHGQDEG